MLNIIIKIKDEYFIWDLNSKSPKTNGMNVKDLQYWIQEQEKQDGLDSFETRLKRVNEIGTSIPEVNIEEIIKNNKAGATGEELTIDQIFNEYNYKAKINNKTIYSNEVNTNQETEDSFKQDMYSGGKQQLRSIDDEWIIGMKVGIYLIILVIISTVCLTLIQYPNWIDNKEINAFLLKNKPIFTHVLTFIVGLTMSNKLRIWFRKPKIVNIKK